MKTPGKAKGAAVGKVATSGSTTMPGDARSCTAGGNDSRPEAAVPFAALPDVDGSSIDALGLSAARRWYCPLAGLSIDDPELSGNIPVMTALAVTLAMMTEAAAAAIKGCRRVLRIAMVFLGVCIRETPIELGRCLNSDHVGTEAFLQTRWQS